MKKNRRLGFTIIEVVVVIAIMGVLTSLLMAAIQRVRASALQAQCRNNLRQIGMALHQYHDTHHYFPPGCSFQKGADRYPFMSWCTRLLPYLEQEALWNTTVQAYAQNKDFLKNPPHVG